jgi:hypothetical protein
MNKRSALALALVTAVAAWAGCSHPTPKIDSTADYFPLKPNMVWTYRVISKSQKSTYVVTDRVIGPEYVPALKLTGNVVEEFYNLDRAGLRPIIYLNGDGYLSRLSGLDYVDHQIKPPAWGRSEEKNFLPEHLTPDREWQNTLFPYGKLPGGFDVAQSHHSVVETDGVTTPAGHFENCIRIDTQAKYEGGAYAQQKQSLKLTYVDWYAPNVGLVKTVAYQGGPGGPVMEQVELLRFVPNDQPAAGSATAAAPAAPSAPAPSAPAN